MLVRGPAPPSHGGVCCLAVAWFWREDELRTLRVLLVAGGPGCFFLHFVVLDMDISSAFSLGRTA